MTERRGGLVTGRNLAIVGGGLLVAAAGSWGYSRMQQLRAEQPDLQLAWNYKPFDQVVDRSFVNLEGHTGRASRHDLAVLSVDRHAFDEHLSRTEGLPALAVRGDDDKWYAGVLQEGEFGETGEVHLQRRAVAVRLGSPALAEVQLGIMDEDRYVPFDTDMVDLDGARDIRREYPDVPLLNVPPIEFGVKI